MRNPDGPGGLGLGVFIAKTLLERSGARLRFFNARVGGHASVEITWQRAALSLAETEHEN
jgi:two-component system, sensor histidine kinase RegB